MRLACLIPILLLGACDGQIENAVWTISECGASTCDFATPVVIGSTIHVRVDFDVDSAPAFTELYAPGFETVDFGFSAEAAGATLLAQAPGVGAVGLTDDDEHYIQGPQLTTIGYDELVPRVLAPGPIEPTATSDAEVVYEVPAGTIELAATPQVTGASMGRRDLRPLTMRFSFPAGDRPAVFATPDDPVTITVGTVEQRVDIFLVRNTGQDTLTRTIRLIPR